MTAPPLTRPLLGPAASVCRLAWLALGTSLGCLPQVGQTGACTACASGNGGGGQGGGAGGAGAEDGGPDGAAGAMGSGLPTDWRCPAAWFGAGDGCDCGCGVVDPDCADTTAGSCDSCDVSQGACGDCAEMNPAQNGRCVAAPVGWTCARSLYRDGTCDCGCGAVDADCPSASAEACARCRSASDGGCGLDGQACPGWIAAENNATCVDATGWTCAAGAFGDGVCDCGCGIVDVDCPGQSSASCENCPAQGCNGATLACPDAIVPDDNAVCVARPVDWTCPPFLFGDGACDCGCGAFDSDCATASAASCGVCHGAGDGGCNAADTCPGSIAASNNAVCSDLGGWTCAPAYFASGDGLCDCGCGIADPDCASASAASCDVCHDALDGGCNIAGLACPGSIRSSDNSRCQ